GSAGLLDGGGSGGTPSRVATRSATWLAARTPYWMPRSAAPRPRWTARSTCAATADAEAAAERAVSAGAAAALPPAKASAVASNSAGRVLLRRVDMVTRCSPQLRGRAVGRGAVVP